MIIVPSYNNSKWYKKNLDSIFKQKYKNFRVIYIDDSSTDDTFNLVKDYLLRNNLFNKVNLIQNKDRKGATYNRYIASHLCNDDEIVLILDGDDWFAHRYVFKIINKVYSKENIWLTYGQFLKWPLLYKGQCKYLNQDYNFRSMDQWYTSALRTYYAWLFKRINKEDLMQDDKFLQVSGDVAEMLPMLEMARGHIKFINKILYIYNVKTEINDFKIHSKEQIETMRFIQSKKSYEKTSM